MWGRERVKRGGCWELSSNASDGEGKKKQKTKGATDLMSSAQKRPGERTE